jgi:hypothetical protein
MADKSHEEEPQPAKPILASHLLQLEQQRRKNFTSNGGPERLSCRCAEIDALLGGEGIERGVVVGISAEGDDGRLVSSARSSRICEGVYSSRLLDPNRRMRKGDRADKRDRFHSISWLQHSSRISPLHHHRHVQQEHQS